MFLTLKTVGSQPHREINNSLFNFAQCMVIITRKSTNDEK